jgi:hypothetical protein
LKELLAIRLEVLMNVARAGSLGGLSKRETLCHRRSAVEIPITIVDVSSGGAGFIYSSPLVPGEQFVLRITGREGDGVVVECAVRWQMKTGSGRCRIGSEFIRVMDCD